MRRLYGGISLIRGLVRKGAGPQCRLNRESAARLGGFLQLAKAILDLLLVLRLGQLALGDLQQLGYYCGLQKALDEVHSCSKLNGDRLSECN